MPPRQILQTSHSAGVSDLAFSPSGRWLASVSEEDGSVRVWDVERRAALTVIHHPQVNAPQQVAWADEQHVVVSGRHRLAREQYTESMLPARPVRLDAATGAQVETFPWVPHPLRRGGRARWASRVARDAIALFDATQAKVGQLTLPVGVTEVRDVTHTSDGRVVAGIADGPAASAVVWTVDGADGTGRVVPLGGPGPGIFKVADAGDWAVGFYGDPFVLALDAANPVRRALAMPRLRWPLGAARAVNDVAISPDGKLAAVASNVELMVFDVRDARLLWWQAGSPGRLSARRAWAGGFRTAAFSPDGAALVAADSAGTLHAFHASTGRELGRFGAVVRQVRDVVFLDDDTLATAALGEEDGAARTAVASWSLREGRRLASARYDGRGAIGVTSTGGLVVAHVPDETECDEGVQPVVVEAWRGTLPAAATAPTARLREVPWPPAPGTRVAACMPGFAIDTARGEGHLHELDAVHGNLLVTSVATLGSRVASLPRGVSWSVDVGGFPPAFAAGGALVVNGAAVADAKGGQRVRRLPDDEHAVWTITTAGAVSPDGRHHAFATAAGTQPDESRRATAMVEHLELTTLPEGALEGALTVDVGVTALAYVPGSRRLLAGSRDGTLLVIADGKVAARGRSDGGGIVRVRTSPNGRTAATLSEDGATRVWDAATATLRGTLVEFDDDEWAAVAPDGTYGGTSEVSERVGWRFEAPLEFFGFERFAADFRAPERVARHLRGESAGAPTRVVRPPRVTIVSAQGSGARARLRVSAASNEQVEEVRAWVEGRPAGLASVCSARGEATLEVPLFPGKNRVTVVGLDRSGAASNAAVAELGGDELRSTRPEVWVVAVGIGAYPHLTDRLDVDAGRKLELDERMQLPAAVNDARGVASAFAAMAGPGRPFAAAHTVVLDDASATPARIAAALESLGGMKREDVGVVFFAGHGLKPSTNGDMVFVTGGARLAPDGVGLLPESLRDDAIGWPRIASALNAARGRLLVLLDACHSGHVTQDVVVPNEALARALSGDRAGLVVFAASKGRQESLEPDRARGLKLTTRAPGGDRGELHGYFTGALLESLRSASTDHDGDGDIALSELVSDVGLRVASASEGMQTPWVARRELFGDFRIARAPRTTSTVSSPWFAVSPDEELPPVLRASEHVVAAPPQDRDHDGMPDAGDGCPDAPEDTDGFEDADGCPDPDNDRDGVDDVADECGLDPGPAPTGCPRR